MATENTAVFTSYLKENASGANLQIDKFLNAIMSEQQNQLMIRAYNNDFKLAEALNNSAYNNTFPLSPFTPPKQMKITAKSYLLVTTSGQCVDADENKDALRSRGAALAHSSQASVYIFRPDLEIAPKRDVVETPITLDK